MNPLATPSWEPIAAYTPPGAGRRARRALVGAVAGALALLAAPTPTLHAQQPARAGRALSLDDAFVIAERQSEAVRIAEAGVQRARGQQLQSRSVLLPQLNATGAYQRQVQSQFQALQKKAAASAPAPTGPQLSSVCAPNIPATATAEQRAAAISQAQSCAQAGGDLGGITRAFANPNTVILGLSGSQLLFPATRAMAGVRASAAGRRAAEIGLTAARAQLRLDVAQAYYDAALADRLVSIAESSLVQTERAFRQTALGRQVGNVAEFDLLRARVARDNQRPVLIQSRTQRDVAYLRLRQLLELPLDEPLVLTTTLPVPPGGAVPAAGVRADATVPADATARRPAGGVAFASDTARITSVAVNVDELLADDPAVTAAVDSIVARADTSARDRASARQAGENVSAQRSLLRAARAQRLPAVQLSTNYQRFGYPVGDGLAFPSASQFVPNWTVTLGVSVPLLTGGRIRGDELVAQANLREAQETAQQVEELSALDARLAVAQLAQAEAAWRASGGTAAQAARAYDIAEVRFREGIATQVELADSRLLLQQAQANGAQAARDLQVARLRLALLRDLPLQGAQSAAATTPRQGSTGSTSQQQQQPQRQQQSAQQGGAGFSQTGTTGSTP